MVRTALAAGVAALSLTGISPSGKAASADAATVRAPSESGGECHRVESERFAFHSDPWINLHHFLFQWARDVSPRQSGDRRRAVEVSEQRELEGLDDEEQQAWRRAVDFYGERLVAAELVRSKRQAQPLPRWLHSAAVVDGKIYLMGGAGADNQPVTSVEVYDPATGRWSECAGMPTPRALFGASVVGGRIYAVGGTTMGLDKLAVAEAYDPATDTWSRRADMPTPRNSLSAVAVDGKIYAIGGWGFDRPDDGWESVDLTNAAAFSTVEVYDPETDAWAVGMEMPTPRAPMAVSAMGGTIFAIGGGVRRAGQDVSLSVMEVYDTTTDRWAPAADMPTPRFAPSSGVIDGRIYVTGGATTHGPASSQIDRERSRTPLSVVEVYDPAAGRWTRDADLTTPRGWHSTSVVNGKLYVIGGRSLAPDGGILEMDGVIPGVEVYTPTDQAVSRSWGPGQGLWHGLPPATGRRWAPSSDETQRRTGPTAAR